MARPMAAPHNAKRWWDPADLTVGTGEASNSYLFQRRVRIQLEIASRAKCPSCGADGLEPPLRTYGRRCDRCDSRLGERDAVDTIADVRCWLENEDLSLARGGLDLEQALSIEVVGRLKGGTLSDAAAATFDDSEGQPTLIEDAVRAALRDWAAKFGGRDARLPPLPEPETYRPPLAVRILRRIPFFRGIGL
ncbi:MAG TPA: hypothetical protein VLC10_03490 [Patescibacteria group bacterium]|nr:hypothetical protein [Patescibacteria group bacterium]